MRAAAARPLPQKAATAAAKGGAASVARPASSGIIKAHRPPCSSAKTAREDGGVGGQAQEEPFVPDARADASASAAAAGTATAAATTASCLDALQEAYLRACAAGEEKDEKGEEQAESVAEQLPPPPATATAAATAIARRQRLSMAREELHWGLQRYCPQAQALQDLWLQLRQGSEPLRLLAPSLASSAAAPPPLPPADLRRAQAAAASAARARLLQEWLPRAAAALAAPSSPLKPANNDAAGFWRAVAVQTGVQLRGLVDEELAALARAVGRAAARPLLQLEVVAVVPAAASDDKTPQPLTLMLRPSAAEARDALLAAVDSVAVGAVSALPTLGEGVVRAAAAAAGAARAAAAAAEVAAAAAKAVAADAAEEEGAANDAYAQQQEEDDGGGGVVRRVIKRPSRLRGFHPPADRARQVKVVTAAAFEASLEAAKAATATAEALQRQGVVVGRSSSAAAAASATAPPPPLLRLDPSKDSAVAAARAAVVRATEADMGALEALVAPRLAPLLRELDGLMLPTTPRGAGGRDGPAATAAAAATKKAEEEEELARRHAAPFVDAVARALAVKPPPGAPLISTASTAAALAACGAEVARLRACAAAARGQPGEGAAAAAYLPPNDDVPSVGGVCLLRCGSLKAAMAAAAERGAAAVLSGVAAAARSACDGAAAEYEAAHAEVAAGAGEGVEEGAATTRTTADGVLRLHRAIARCSGSVAAAHACPETGVLARVALARAFLFERRWPPASAGQQEEGEEEERPQPEEEEEGTATGANGGGANGGASAEDEEEQDDDVLAWVEAARWPARLAHELAQARTRAAAERRSLERALAARSAALTAEATAGDATSRRGLAEVSRRDGVVAEIDALDRRLDAALRELRDVSAQRAALLLPPSPPPLRQEEAEDAAEGLEARLERARDSLKPHAELWSCVCDSHARLAHWTGAPIARVDAKEAREGAARLQARLSAVERALMMTVATTRDDGTSGSSSSSSSSSTPAQQVLSDTAARLAAFCEGPGLPLLTALRPSAAGPARPPLPDALWAALNREAGLDLNRGEAVSLKGLVSFCGAAGAGRLIALATGAAASAGAAPLP